MRVLRRSLVAVAVAAAGLVTTQANAQPGMLDYTGLNLGVYVYQTAFGMRVSQPIHCTPAANIGIRRGDVIMALASNGRVYPTRTLCQLRHAKAAIGPNVWTAVKIWRPGVGYWFPWVQLSVPMGGQAACKTEPMAVWKGENAGSRQAFAAGQGQGDPNQPPPPPATNPAQGANGQQQLPQQNGAQQVSPQNGSQQVPPQNGAQQFPPPGSPGEFPVQDGALQFPLHF